MLTAKKLKSISRLSKFEASIIGDVIEDAVPELSLRRIENKPSEEFVDCTLATSLPPSVQPSNPVSKEVPIKILSSVVKTVELLKAELDVSHLELT